MRRSFRSRWWVVFASICGLMVGEGPIYVFTMGVFLKPVTEDLGLDRGAFSSALMVRAALTALACPFLGWLIDRRGVRRVLIPGLLLYALVTAGYSLIQASPFVLTLLLFAVAGPIASCQTPIPYAAVTTRWFDTRRGLALGIAISGVGLGVAALPPLAAGLIGAFGWRLAFVSLAVGVLAIGLVPVAVLIRDPPEFATGADRQRPHASAMALPGISLVEASRGQPFWLLSGAFFLCVIAINGTLTHIVALLTDRGMTLAAASATLSGAGIALILGRIASGWCLDRLWGPYVAIVFVLLPMVGIALLCSGAGGLVPLVAAIACGLGIGAELGVMAFLASRYFGLRSYAKIYGSLFAIFELGIGVGPALSGASFDLFHSYQPIFLIYEVMLAAGCVLYLRLGPYPYPASARIAAGGELKAVV